MPNELIVYQDDLSRNPAIRTPCILCLDVSYSMNGTPIDDLKNGIQLFIKTIDTDIVAKASVEVCVVTFNSTAQVVCDFDDWNTIKTTEHIFVN